MAGLEHFSLVGRKALQLVAERGFRRNGVSIFWVGDDLLDDRDLNFLVVRSVDLQILSVRLAKGQMSVESHVLEYSAGFPGNET